MLSDLFYSSSNFRPSAQRSWPVEKQTLHPSFGLCLNAKGISKGSPELTKSSWVERSEQGKGEKQQGWSCTHTTHS